jgi:hypothetical protein
MVRAVHDTAPLCTSGPSAPSVACGRRPDLGVTTAAINPARDAAGEPDDQPG